MTDPTPLGGASEDDIARELAAKQAAAPSGVTDVDVNALLQAIQQMQGRVDALEAEKRAAGGKHPLTATTEALADFMAHVYADTTGHQLALDLKEAAANAVEHGGLDPVGKILPKIQRFLERNAPAPGENYHYRQAVELARFHIPDHVDDFTPPAKALQVQGGQPVKVAAGSVVG